MSATTTRKLPSRTRRHETAHSSSSRSAPPPPIPLYQRILYPASSPPPPRPPRILRSPAHTTLDPLILDLIALSLRAYVASWYNSSISPDPDKAFLQSITKILIHVVQALEVRLTAIDFEELILEDVPAVLERHYRDWGTSEEMYRRGTLSTTHGMSRDEIFDRIHPHLAVRLETTSTSSTTSRPTPHVDRTYLRTLVDHLLELLLPEEDFQCDTERFIVREVLVGIVFGTVFNKVAQPWFLQGIVARLLEAREEKKREESVTLEKKQEKEKVSIQIEETTIVDKMVSILSSLPSYVSSAVSIATKLISTLSTSPTSPSNRPQREHHLRLISLIESLLPPQLATSHLLHYLSLSLSLPLLSTPLNAYLSSQISQTTSNPKTVESILRGVTRGMFPKEGGWPGDRVEDPDEAGQRDIERRCKVELAKLVPDSIATYLTPPPTQDIHSDTKHPPSPPPTSPSSTSTPPTPAQLSISTHLLRPFTSHTANVHLFVTLIDLIVGKICPELLLGDDSTSSNGGDQRLQD